MYILSDYMVTLFQAAILFGMCLFVGIYWQTMWNEDKIRNLKHYAKKMRDENTELKKNE